MGRTNPAHVLHAQQVPVQHGDHVVQAFHVFGFGDLFQVGARMKGAGLSRDKNNAVDVGLFRLQVVHERGKILHGRLGPGVDGVFGHVEPDNGHLSVHFIWKHRFFLIHEFLRFF
ncbi:MAG: hypothetical protein JRJ60_20230 [Deltaproteobacteria bacterium]|nr:hypothetical protein [Deltaproteobacteria bacterium]